MGKFLAKVLLLGFVAAAAYVVLLYKDVPLSQINFKELLEEHNVADIFTTQSETSPELAEKDVNVSEQPAGGEDAAEAGEETQKASTGTKAAAEEAMKASPYGEIKLELARGFQSRSDQFTASYKGDRNKLSAEMKGIIREALSLDDYSAYVLESYAYTIRSWGGKSNITVEARYRESVEETAIVEAKADQVLAEILKPDMNDHEKIKAIHDWVVTHVEYDQSLSYYTAYHAVSLGKAVCQGYSLLGYIMLKKSGFDVLIAEGSVNTGEHAWNMVKLDGDWYHLDLTWDDPVGVQDDIVRYTYYLRTDEEMRRDHTWTRVYPEASTAYADTLRDLEREGSEEGKLRFGALKIALGLHWLEPENTVSGVSELQQVIASAASSRSMGLQFRYLDAEGFQEALESAFQHVGGGIGYRASYEPYNGENSLLVNLQLKYP
ncbi:transglutaminase domain-containing protein [Paenibacillus sp. CAU 1782]